MSKTATSTISIFKKLPSITAHIKKPMFVCLFLGNILYVIRISTIPSDFPYISTSAELISILCSIEPLAPTWYFVFLPS